MDEHNIKSKITNRQALEEIIIINNKNNNNNNNKEDYRRTAHLGL
jgi:hypothetical protein